MEGKVKFFNNEKKYGFIFGEGEKEYFVHGTEVDENINLRQDMKVTFDVVEGKKGEQAVNVKKIQDKD